MLWGQVEAEAVLTGGDDDDDDDDGLEIIIGRVSACRCRIDASG